MDGSPVSVNVGGLVVVIVAALAATIVGMIAIKATLGLPFSVTPWRIYWPSKVKAYRKLRFERVKAGTFFNVTAQCGHFFEMSGMDLCERLNQLGDYLTCPECSKFVRVTSIVNGRFMTEPEREKQMKDYQTWKEEMNWLTEFLAPPILGS